LPDVTYVKPIPEVRNVVNKILILKVVILVKLTQEEKNAV